MMQENSCLPKSIVKHCAVHTIISAIPSFALALMAGFNSMSQIAGMLCGILLFLVCAFVLHIKGPLPWMLRKPFAGKAIRWVKLIRMVQAILMLPAFFLGSPRIFLPLLVDMYAGVVALGFLEKLGYVGMGAYYNTSHPESRLFTHTFLTTFIEGWILALLMVAVGVILWIAFRVWDLLQRSQQK